MTYPYSGRDLFAEPESYAYAICDDANYLDEWRASRRAAMDALNLRATESSTEKGVVDAVPPPDAITLHSLLRETPKSVTALDPWIVKFEVFGRFFAQYCEDFRRHPESPSASIATYILFAKRLCENAETSGSLKKLSTLLKLCDALASQPATKFHPNQAAELVTLFKREASLVVKLVESE